MWRWWCFLWASGVLFLKACKEAVQVVEQSDVALTASWCDFVICDGLNALQWALCILAVLEVGGYLVCVILFCFPDATG